VGYQALYTNTIGSYNTALGVNALLNNGSSYNTATGAGALQANTTGSPNTAVGYNALNANVVGTNNVAVGDRALSVNTAGNNTAVGSSALAANTTGAFNTASGFLALYTNTTGNNNIAVGLNALYFNTTGSGNTAINPGNSLGAYVPVFSPTTENNRFCMGSTAVTNAYINVAWTVVSDARDKTNIAPLHLGLDFITKLDPVEYQRVDNREDKNASGPVRYGFLAQDILAVEGDKPVVVDNEDPERLKMNDSALIAVLVKAVKELTTRLEALEGAK
jgi:hypothetical protein